MQKGAEWRLGKGMKGTYKDASACQGEVGMEWEWREKGESTGHKGCLEEEEKCELLSIWRKVWKIIRYMMLVGGV